MWFLYQLAVLLLLLLAGPFLLLLRGRHYLPTLPGRLGLSGPDPDAPPPSRGGLWLHAVSVGEVAVAATLVRGLPAELPLLVTTTTPTGQGRAQATFSRRAAVGYFPFELAPAISRLLRRFEPRALVLMEGEYWPLVLRAARRRRMPVYVINGRVSDRSFRRLDRLRGWPMLRGFLRLFFSSVEGFGVQSAADRQRLLDLGVEPRRVRVTGNLKYETPEPPRRPEVEAWLRSLAGDRAVFLAGSTMEGEEDILLQAFDALGDERALLVLAPRHPERWEEVARRLEATGRPVARRSRADLEAAEAPAAAANLVLLDSLGELAGLYRMADGAFIGGTLVPTGGHNPLEAARFGVPVAVGPSMENFRDMAERFDAAAAWARVTDAESLATLWRGWLDDPEAGRSLGRRGAGLIEENRGALDATLEMLAPCLGGPGGSTEPAHEQADSTEPPT